jgi:diguanylate cyclase (GGDEF)-like protein/PAS domain S-box-containing protein
VADLHTTAPLDGASPLQILVLEDSHEDFETSVRTLEGARLKVRAFRAESREEFQDLTKKHRYDAILSDFALKGWSGMEALEQLRDAGNNTPFIVITNALGEEKAVQCIKEGAADLVLKSKITSLPGAVCRAIYDKSIRDSRTRAEVLLRESEYRFRVLVDSIASAVLIYRGTECRYANKAAQELTGYSETELMDLNSWNLIHPDSRELVIERGFTAPPDARSSTRYEAKILTKKGEVRVWDVNLARIEMQGEPAGLITAVDITDLKLAENSGLAGMGDPLTGLMTSVQAQGVFLAEAKRSQRTNRSFAVMVLKVNDFQQINEQHGYSEGSRILCKLANVVGQVCRAADSAARLTQDEFVLILPETVLAGTSYLVRRIAQKLNEETANGTPFAVSAGAASFPHDGPTMDKVLTAAQSTMRMVDPNAPLEELVRSA